jgi:hypothetical protein
MYLYLLAFIYLIFPYIYIVYFILIIIMNFTSKRLQFREKNALRVRVGIFILFSSPSLSHSCRWPSLSTDSTSGPSLSRHLFLSDSLYLAVLMFYLYHLMFYLNIFLFFLICRVELFLYVLLNFFFIFLYVVLNFVSIYIYIF